MPPNTFASTAICAYKNAHDTTGVTTTLSATTKRIRDGSRGLAEKTKNAHILAQTDPDAYRNYKEENLPAVTFSGTFPKGLRRAQHLSQHAGLITLDIDNLPTPSIPDLLVHLAELPQTALAFVSPSGEGIKAIVPVDPIPTNATEHKGAYAECLEFFDDLATEFNFQIDTSGSDCSRLCFLAHDPLTITNPNPIPITWDRDAYLESLRESESKARNTPYQGDVDTTTLDYINPDTDYDLWINVGIACYNSGVPMSVWDQWSQQGSKYNPGECARKWETFRDYTGRKITWATVVHRAKENGYVPPKTARTSPVRLSQHPDSTTEAETLHTLRQLLRKKVRDWEIQTRNTRRQYLLILATGAGTGKSTSALLNLNKYADISPTIQLADEKYHTALNAGKNALRHRPRNYNRDTAKNYTPKTVPIGLDATRGEVPCAYPDICNALAEKGYSPVRVFCYSCPRADECCESGYLSQWNLMPTHNAIFFSYQDDFFSDSLYLPFLNAITKGKKRAFVLVLDEVDPAALPPKRSYNTEHLKQITYDYRDFDAGTFLKMLIEETANLTTNLPNGLDIAQLERAKRLEWAKRVKTLLGKFQPSDLNAIDIQLNGIPAHACFQTPINVQNDLNGKPLYRTLAKISYRGTTRIAAVLNDDTHPTVFETLNKTPLDGWVHDTIFPTQGWQHGKSYPVLLKVNTFCRLGFGAMDTPENVSRLPSQPQNFTADLLAFIDTLNSETPACHEEKDGNTHIGWTYYLQPSMNTRRGILISASGVTDIIRQLYAHTDIEIDVIDGKPPAWQEGCKIFQLSTGRYSPARSLIDCDKNQDYKPTRLRPRGRELLNIIANEAENGKQILVVGPKDFTADGRLTDTPEIQKLLTMPNVHVINHHHAEGVNQYDHCSQAFIFLYEPRPDEIEKIASRIYRNETLCFDRELVTLTKAGVVLEEVYRYKDPRLQAIFDKECEKRLMQAITRLRQMIHPNRHVFLLTSEPVSGLPVNPILCTIDDLKAAQAEYGTLDGLEMFLENRADRSVTQIAEQDGISQRTAYRRTQKQRNHAKAELLKNILELKNSGISIRKIADALDLSRGKIEGILKKNTKLS